MTKTLVLLLSIAAVLIEIANAVDYCELQCKNGTQSINHTLCQYTADVKCEISKYDVIKVGLDEEEKEAILNLHNILRKRIESGNETRGLNGPQPATQFMPELVWDNELANTAQHWANQCIYGYDQCRRTENYDVGQNIGKWKLNVFAKSANGTLIKPKSDMPAANVSTLKVEQIVQQWYDYVVLWDKNDTYKPFKNIEEYKEGNKVQLFTQMIWAKTTKIGCGAVRYGGGLFLRKLYLVCNYGPAGNVPGQRLYIPVDDIPKNSQLVASIILPKGAKITRKIPITQPDSSISAQVEFLNSKGIADVRSKPLEAGAEIISMEEEKRNNGTNIVVIVRYYLLSDE